jgi:PAS domain S-box-containing protein
MLPVHSSGGSTPTASRANPRYVHLLRATATRSAVFSISVGLSGLVGWRYRLTSLLSWNLAPVTMKANTCLCFVLLGLSLWLARQATHHPFTRARAIACKTTAALASLIGLLTLSEHLFGANLGIDQLLMAQPAMFPNDGLRLGLMSPLTAAGFSLCGFVLLSLDWRTRHGYRPAQILSLLTAAGATSGLFSFAVDPRIYAAHLSLSLPSAVTIFIVSFGSICVRPESGLGSLLCSRDIGGVLLRRLLPAVFIPVFQGWFRWRISTAGFSAWTIEVIAAVTSMGLLVATIAWVAVVVDRSSGEQRKLEEARERLAAIVDSSADAIISKALDGTVTHWNDGAEKLFGYESSEALGRTTQMILPPDQENEEAHILADIALGHRVFHFETVRVRKDGHRLDVSVTVSPVRDSTGAIVGLSSISRDITRRKQTEAALEAQVQSSALSEQALRTQSTLLRSVLDNINEGLVAVNRQGRFIIWNAAAKRILGLGPTDLPIAQWSAHYGFFELDCITPVGPGQSPLALALEGTTTVAEMFVRNHAIPGGTWVESSGHPMRDVEGVSQGAVVALWDITQRKKHEQLTREGNEELEQRVLARTAELAEASKELEIIADSMAHDLRTPLRHIAGFAAIVMEDFGLSIDPKAVRYLERMREAAAKVGELLDELLGLMRVGRQETRMQSIDLNRVVRESIAFLHADTEGRQVLWNIADLPGVEGDAKLIKRVFLNLISNALKYSRPRSPAIIEIGQNAKKAFFVRDNGVGFNMEYADKVFRLFQRLHHTEDFEGNGVGLATVQRIIRKHKGSVWAEAEPNKGATFFFTIGS